MSVTLAQILTLCGRLDDTPGFDVPRERFRRFLLEHARDMPTVRALIEQCHHVPDDQHRRALQDLVVLLGRFLGFEAIFGAYVPVADAVTYHGRWRSPSHLHVVVEVRTDQTPGSDAGTFDALTRAVAAATVRGPRVRPAGLAVLTPLAPNRQKFEAAMAVAPPAFPLSLMSLHVVLSLAEMVTAGRVTHDDVARVLESNMPVEFIVELLERSGSHAGVDAQAVAAAGAAPGTGAPHEPGFWIATVAADQATSPEQWLELVVGQRHIFGISGNATQGAAPRSGDHLCFYIPGKGVVGHGRVRAMAASGGGIRDADRFRQLLQLDDIDLDVRAPIGVDDETQLRLRTAPPAAGRHGQMLVRISRESFTAMTSPRREPRDDATTERPARRVLERGGPRSA